MNIRLLSFISLSFLLCNSPLMFASEAGPASAASTELGKCAICLEEMTPKELADGKLVKRQRPFWMH